MHIKKICTEKHEEPVKLYNFSLFLKNKLIF